MTRLLLSTTAIGAVLAVASPALAGPNSDIQQTSHAVQEIVQDVLGGHDVLNVQQTGVNAANLVNVNNGEILDDIDQLATADQSIENVVRAADDARKITQSGTNVLNSISSNGQVDTVDQSVFSKVDQSVFNLVRAWDDAQAIQQTGVNAANLISISTDAVSDGTDILSINDIEGDVNQIFRGDQAVYNKISIEHGDLQSAWVEIDGAWVRVGAIQKATNVANSINAADDIEDDVYQGLESFHGRVPTQSAVNEIDYENVAKNIVQEATNAANILSVGDDVRGDITQYVTYGAWQYASNSVWDDANGTDGYHDYVKNLEQTATNVANVVNVGTKATDDVVATVGDANDISQTTHGTQLASNYVEFGSSNHHIDLEDATQTATNAANLATLTGEVGIVRQWSSGNWQTALNTAVRDSGYDGDVKNLTQSATNVTNVLSVGSIISTGSLEVAQYSSTPQYASNLVSNLGGSGNIADVVQSATNVTNSVTVGLSN